ncbi:MAG: zinc-binding dehydrogenase [Pseudomonadales bacterium]|nr:zinc-binding dehydrogenase [Pseudomonadales bacterium]
MPLQLCSTVRKEGLLELSLVEVDMPTPGEDDVVIRVDASPINPSDLGLLFGMADMSTATLSGTGSKSVLAATIPEAMMRQVVARVDQSLPAGNEGAGVVVSAGSSERAQSLMGKTVATLGGAMYAQYRMTRVDQCLVLPEGTTAVEGASCFVNPLTVLGMVGTMRLEGHTALVHTAAASNLGQMLVKLCVNEDVPLVNVVRKREHVELLESLGATHVCDSSEPNFMAELIDALADTGATLGFDATGGGPLPGQLLTAMEVAASRDAGGFNRYGSTTHKQVYIYGGLDRNPTVLNRSFGMAWGLGGWLLPYFLQRVGDEEAESLRQRVAAEITSTFASSYTEIVSLEEAISPEAVARYGLQATGEKFLINPNKNLDG